MPGNIAGAAPTLVMPQQLCTAFSEARDYAQLRNQYHDGSPEASQLAQTSRRTFKLSRRLTASQLTTLRNFYTSVNGGLTPFLFYNPYEGSPIGSNYDATGVNPTGRCVVVFRNSWQQATGSLRTDVQNFELIELYMDPTYADLAGFGPHGAIEAATLKTLTTHTSPGTPNAGVCAGISSAWGSIGLFQNVINADSTDWTLRTDSLTLISGGSPVSGVSIPLAGLSALVMNYCFRTTDWNTTLDEQLLIYDCWIELTYADSTTATLRPTSYQLVPAATVGGTGFSTLSNPQNAYDSDNTSCATLAFVEAPIWPSVGIGSSDELQLTSFTNLS